MARKTYPSVVTQEQFDGILPLTEMGCRMAVHVTTANVTDRTGAVAMVMKEQGNLVHVERVPIDAGYTGKPFAETIQATIGAAVEGVKRSELHTFKLMTKLWVVERSFSSLEKCRRL